VYSFVLYFLKNKKNAKCQICGLEDESGYHAVVRCSMAVALRYELRNIWRLPEERRFSYTGPDWLLHLLASVDKDARDKTMLLLWHAWKHQNNIMHGNGRATVSESVEFLKSYATVMEGSPSSPYTGTSSKGKEKVWEGVGPNESQNTSAAMDGCSRSLDG
jgi:hypothetical protein